MTLFTYKCKKADFSENWVLRETLQKTMGSVGKKKDETLRENQENFPGKLKYL